MRGHQLLAAMAVLLAAPALMNGAENLKLNPHLNYMKNGFQGPLITGDHMDDGVAEGMPNYIIFYDGYCYNAKRQAQRTVELYRIYKDRVHFVIVDWSHLTSSRRLPPALEPLSKKYFRGEFPHTTIVDKSGKVVFNYTGETGIATLMGWLDSTVWSASAHRWPGDPQLSYQPEAASRLPRR